MPLGDYKTIHPKTRKAWREWLEKNHQSSPGIWLIYYKKESGKRRVTYNDSVEEALCYGWIDSLPCKLDPERAMLKFTPRKPKSVWSELNKRRIEQLLKNNLMTDAGLSKINLAKKNGSWDILTKTDQQARSNTMPKDFEKALKQDKKAYHNFIEFPQGYRRQFLFWIDSARRAETKTVRILQSVKMAAANKKPGPAGFKL